MEPTQTKKQGLSTASLGVIMIGIFLTALVVVAGIIIWKSIDIAKGVVDDVSEVVVDEIIKNTDVGIIVHGTDSLTLDQAKLLVSSQWDNLGFTPKTCTPDMEGCPKLSVSVRLGERGNDGNSFWIINAEVTGFADDSNSGYGKQGNVYFKDGAWSFGASEWETYEYKLCRANIQYPKGALCP